jgi:hypothetical protein
LSYGHAVARLTQRISLRIHLHWGASSINIPTG